MPYSNITREALREEIRARLFSRFWTDSELNSLINESLRVWGALTGYWKTSIPIEVTANTLYYPIENLTNYLAILRIELTDHHLNPVTLEELDNMVPNWQCADADVPQFAALIGLDKLAFYPRPEVNTEMDIVFLRKAPIPTDDADFIQVANEEIGALINWCQFAASIKEGGAELQAAIPYLQAFLQQAAKYNSKLNKISVFRALLGAVDFKQARPDTNDAQFSRSIIQEQVT